MLRIHGASTVGFRDLLPLGRGQRVAQRKTGLPRCAGRWVSVAASAILLTSLVAEAPAFVCSRGSASSALRPAVRERRTLRRAESFDPFGIKSALKETTAGLFDSATEEKPSELDEQMMIEIFAKFDADSDGILNIDEFNALQQATEGSDAVYNADQLKDLLLTVNGDLKSPELGMPFAEYRRLYVSRRLKNTYNTDVNRDHVKIFGPGGGDASGRAEARISAGLFEGVAVKVQGLKGAVELNGREGHIVAPNGAEAALVVEDRVVVSLAGDGERVALKLANVVAKTQLAD